MKTEQVLYTRRKMLSTSALIAGVGALSMAGLVGCAPKGSKTSGTKKEAINWDETVDIVVCGSGCGMYAALVAANEGAQVTVLEKGPSVGGTTRVSGSMCWVPNNVHMADEGVTELSHDEIVGYIAAADTFHNANPAIINHFVTHARDAFAYMETDLGMPMGVRMSLPLRGDYYNLPGALPQGRSMDFLDADGNPTGKETFDKILIPKAEELGVNLVTDAAVTEFITDDTNRVCGVAYTVGGGEPVFIEATKGVIVATGGFDFNPDMMKAFQRGPVLTSQAVPTNTGDGQLLGVAVGAGLGNMQNCWGIQAVVTQEAEETGEYSSVKDWGGMRSKPNSMLVNRHGRRFTNEASSYATCNPAFYAYDTTVCTFKNLPAYLIFDQTYVDYYGYPGVKAEKDKTPEMPSYISKYDTLEELAEAQNINVSGLMDEVSRFNGFAQSGVDLDWHRGEWSFDTKANGDLKQLQQGLASTCMGPVEKAPFYCLKMGPGSCGTSGGLLVNENAQVLQMADNEPIAGLYAIGNCAASIFGSAYPGSGATVGAGVFQGLMAVQNALGYQKY